MTVVKIAIGNQPRSVMRVLREFERRTTRAYAEHGKLELYADALPIVVMSVRDLFPKMRLKRRLALSMQVFDVVENMHRLASEKPPTDAVN